MSFMDWCWWPNNTSIGLQRTVCMLLNGELNDHNLSVHHDCMVYRCYSRNPWLGTRIRQCHSFSKYRCPLVIVVFQFFNRASLGTTCHHQPTEYHWIQWLLITGSDSTAIIMTTCFSLSNAPAAQDLLELYLPHFWPTTNFSLSKPRGVQDLRSGWYALLWHPPKQGGACGKCLGSRSVLQILPILELCTGLDTVK